MNKYLRKGVNLLVTNRMFEVYNDNLQVDAV